MSELRLRDRAAAWLAEARPAVVVEVVGRARLGAARRRHAHARRRRRIARHDRRRAPRAEGDHRGAGDAGERRRRSAQRAVVRARPVARPVLRRRGDARVRAARRGGARRAGRRACRSFISSCTAPATSAAPSRRCWRRSTSTSTGSTSATKAFPTRRRSARRGPRTSAAPRVDTVEREVANAPAGAFFLVLTHEHALDLRITEAILRRGDFAFCGLIGSKTKRASFAHGSPSAACAAAAIERLTCPIGAPASPARAGVIAVAAVAELLRVAAARRGR